MLGVIVEAAPVMSGQFDGRLSPGASATIAFPNKSWTTKGQRCGAALAADLM
ncbi:hypothetical protein BIWAKO_05471 [Bosea sp. BIWAKO-01]|nr:hypothetical protein BIWAKO_05471 [Bosea sp. BIWAKO-01]